MKRLILGALCLALASLPANSAGVLLLAKSAGGGGTNILLVDTGSALLVNTGIKFLVQ